MNIIIFSISSFELNFISFSDDEEKLHKPLSEIIDHKIKLNFYNLSWNKLFFKIKFYIFRIFVKVQC